MVVNIIGRLKAAVSPPPELQEATFIVKAERRNLPSELDRRSRTFVAIRNTTLLILLGVVCWIPLAIVKDTPKEFFEGFQSVVELLFVLALTCWYAIRRIRRHIATILAMIAAEYPEESAEILRLDKIDRWKLPFGPWFRRMYVPGFIEKRWGRLKTWLKELIVVPRS